MLLFSTDIDGTVYDGEQSARLFAGFWAELKSERGGYLAYNTGRALDDTLGLIASTPLPEPDFIISGVGTSIYDVRGERLVQGFHDHLNEGWDPELAHRVVEQSVSDGLSRQPDECQSQHKRSWFWHGASASGLSALEQALVGAGLATQVVYSSARDLDVIPARANKANALLFLMRYLNSAVARTLVAGDSGNDAAMLALGEVDSIVVSNAEAALMERLQGHECFVASQPCASGVIEGLKHYLSS
ncbi:HAD-IIB family hydrolase [Sulfuriroseicoccus oceanibius]|uniref:HAD-IIB family hydrolase n=1 Tax=Sulfuriroseicoccus oceanibius TaxID=2707525 RepID=A0A6B3LBE8_9BACT|nr:HAD-IIB family hydrolase [Sulfuriroseicoccus oceanibius]QQL45984.1 HAD-IIB family hydrolase [Sulfuriroseicoccus oceanibius]